MENELVVFGLVRGYPNLFSKWRYIMQVLRNLSIRIASLRAHENWQILVFHEGNISNIDQQFLKIFSLGPIRFENVSTEFKKPENLKFSGKNSGLGYALMCRFNYLQIWKHLLTYKTAMRLDEDCFLIRAPKMNSFEGFGSAVFCEESHGPTNRSLAGFLESIGLGEEYNHHFPYTNFYMVTPKNWEHSSIRKLLERIGNHPDSLEDRWGDIPVIGVVLNRYKQLVGPIQHLNDVSYFHLSHFSWVRQGKFKSVDFVFDLRHPGKTIASIFCRK